MKNVFINQKFTYKDTENIIDTSICIISMSQNICVKYGINNI